MNSRTTVLATTFLLGLACAGFGFYRLYRNWNLTADPVRTTATVFYLDTRLPRIKRPINSIYRYNGYDDDCYKTLRYHTENGQEILWQSKVSVDIPDWMRGHDPTEEHTASILYDRADPEYWEYDKPVALFVNWFVLFVVGLGLMSLSFGPYDAFMRRLRVSDEDHAANVDAIRESVYAQPIAKSESHKIDRDEEKAPKKTSIVRDGRPPSFDDEDLVGHSISSDSYDGHSFDDSFNSPS